ncbi:hypothetical protein CPC16_011560 [Podila verticillata]|nr:hypothetical protein CPC16_011560 [Podila verticillata]KAI9242337.1 MAG: hypothetical protein BYD32DRAFT_236818 [Podila humilis]
MSEPIRPFAFLTQETSATPQSTPRHRRSSSGHSHNIFSTQPTPTSPNPGSGSGSSGSASGSNPHLDRPASAATPSPMPKLFKVEICNNGDCKSSNPVFYPADIIQGMVYLYLDKPMTLPALKIVFRGESNYPSSKQQDHLDHHMRRLFSVAMTLWGSREALPEDQWGQLPAGNHIFPFTVQLPDKNLPASFDHPWLKNQYTLTAYYRRPNGLSKWQSKAKPINFMPLSTTGCEHGPIQESCPKMGTALLLSHPDLTPGGRVHVKLTAGAAIDRCQFALSRHIRARINETIYKEDEVICHYERKSIPKGELSLVLPIPKITPPTTESSSALKITYSVQVSIWNERFFFKTESHNFDLPIVIRTLPSCDNRTCEGLDWCEPSVDRPMFLTEMPMQPLPLYDADSPPRYTMDLPAYDQVAEAESGAGSGGVSAMAANMEDLHMDEHDHAHDHDHDHDHDDDDSRVSANTSVSSDIGGHESIMPGHSFPHHPSCSFYLSQEHFGQGSEPEASTGVSSSAASSSVSTPVAVPRQVFQTVPRVSLDSQQSEEEQAEEGASVGRRHPSAMNFLQVHTVIESA